MLWKYYSFAVAISLVAFACTFSSVQTFLLNGFIHGLELLDAYFSEADEPFPMDLSDFNISLPHSIEVKEWRVGGRFLRKLVTEGRPVLIENSPVVTWPMMQWDIVHLSNNFSTDLNLSGCRWQPENVFVLGREREKGGMLGSPHDRPVVHVNISLSKFVKALKVKTSKSYYYWTGALESWEAALGTNGTEFNSTTKTWRSFKIFEPSLAGIVDEDDDSIWQPRLWLSPPGVVAQTHYDTQHNVFAQIRGSKRFLLFPPETELYSYPNIHLSHRQSQVHLEAGADLHIQMQQQRQRKSGKGALKRSTEGEGGEEKSNTTNSSSTSLLDIFPLLRGSQAMVVTLRPGDVLYIPPFWQHRVETLGPEPALSLSVLSPSVVEAAFSEAFWQPVPFGSFRGSAVLRRAAALSYLRRLLTHAHAHAHANATEEGKKDEEEKEKKAAAGKDQRSGGPRPQDAHGDKEGTGGTDGGRIPWFKAITADAAITRFASDLYHTRFELLYPAAASSSEPFICGDEVGSVEEILSEGDEALTVEQRVAGAAEDFETAVTGVAALLRDAPAPMEVKTIFLRDYVEELVRWAVGPQLVSTFLLHCLAR